MEFINEDIIDQQAERISSDEAYRETIVEQLREEQPVILAYLFSENIDAFPNTEKEYLLFLWLVIYSAVRQKIAGLPIVTEDAISELEEKNWEKLQEVKARKFRERLDVFFEDSPQEDLLAFVEDALLDDQDEVVSKESREPMFVVLKSLIDCLLEAERVANEGSNT